VSTIWADTNTMTNIDNLIEQLGKLTVVEAGELSKRLEKAWGLDLSALTSAPAPASVVQEESTTATVMLTSFADGKKIPIIKAVRPMLDLGLLEAKNFVEDLPKVVKEDLEREEAEKLKKILEEAGGTVELK
jgi:large subunit ribosomal protein L7/L12